MRRAVTDKEGNVIGTVGDDAAVGQVSALVIDDRMGKYDERDDKDRMGTVNVSVPFTVAKQLAGRRVAIFLLEE